jgi:hypothetical protein
MLKPFAVLAALAALLLAPNAQAASGNLLVIDPDPGESLSGGLAKTFTGDSSTFAADYDEVSVRIGVDYVSPAGDYEGWSIQFAAPPGQPLATGTYTDIARAPFRAWGQAGWDATHSTTGGCNTITGSFTVNAFTWGAFKSNGYHRVSVFDADWEIHCSDRPEALRGHVHYEDPPDTTPPTFVGAGDQTVEAQNESGGVAYYNVWATTTTPTNTSPLAAPRDRDRSSRSVPTRSPAPPPTPRAIRGRRPLSSPFFLPSSGQSSQRGGR